MKLKQLHSRRRGIRRKRKIVLQLKVVVEGKPKRMRKKNLELRWRIVSLAGRMGMEVSRVGLGLSVIQGCVWRRFRAT